ncbi:MAG TPA: tetratricopeptide repeat protein [Rhizomicrobium sp.]|nr:tetratricopeptide repeat protein [Rhizomicrobium sp.]
MSDIFREVEEDVRKERLEKLWKAYGDYVIGLLALIILSVAGYELWLRYEDGQRAKAATAFVAAQHVANPAQAAAAFESLGKTGPGGYGVLARLAQADAMPAAGKANDAIALYKDIASSDSSPVGATARLRAAWLMADTASGADLVTLLAPLTTPTSPWREMAREVLAYSDYKAGKTKEAAAAFDSLATDPDSPDALRGRAKAFAQFLQGGGARDFGTVPPPAALPTPGTPPGKSPPAAAPPKP